MQSRNFFKASNTESSGSRRKVPANTQSSRILSPYSYLKYYNKIVETCREGNKNKLSISQNLPRSRVEEFVKVPIPDFMEKEHQFQERSILGTRLEKDADEAELLRIQKRTENLLNQIEQNNKKQENIVFRIHVPSPTAQPLLQNSEIDFIDNNQKKYFSITKQFMTEINKHKKAQRTNHAQIIEQNTPHLLSTLHHSYSNKEQQQICINEQMKSAEDRYLKKLKDIQRNCDPKQHMSKTILDRKNISLRKILTSIPEKKLNLIYEQKKKDFNNFLQERKSSSKDSAKKEIKPRFRHEYYWKSGNGKIFNQYLQRETHQSGSPNCNSDSVDHIKFNQINLNFLQDNITPESSTKSQIRDTRNSDFTLTSRLIKKHQSSRTQDRIYTERFDTQEEEEIGNDSQQRNMLLTQQSSSTSPKNQIELSKIEFPTQRMRIKKIDEVKNSCLSRAIKIQSFSPWHGSEERTPCMASTSTTSFYQQGLHKQSSSMSPHASSKSSNFSKLYNNSIKQGSIKNDLRNSLEPAILEQITFPKEKGSDIFLVKDALIKAFDERKNASSSQNLIKYCSSPPKKKAKIQTFGQKQAIFFLDFNKYFIQRYTPQKGFSIALSEETKMASDEFQNEISSLIETL